MEAENLISIFDCYWYELEILKKVPHPSNSESSPTQEFPNQSLPTTISTASMDELASISSGGSTNSLSPSSVLLQKRLQTIFSGKEVKDATEEEGKVGAAVQTEIPKSLLQGERRRNRGREHRKKKLERGLTKSLSDLEFMELKGFMDLGFVFSEEDKGSEFLTTILPGLQRLGVEQEKEEEVNTRRKSVDGSGNSRPYSWQNSERNRMRRKKENHQLMKSSENLPSVGNKIHMKDYLKTWAHSVASSVK